MWGASNEKNTLKTLGVCNRTYLETIIWLPKAFIVSAKKSKLSKFKRDRKYF